MPLNQSTTELEQSIHEMLDTLGPPSTDTRNHRISSQTTHSNSNIIDLYSASPDTSPRLTSSWIHGSPSPPLGSAPFHSGYQPNLPRRPSSISTQSSFSMRSPSGPRPLPTFTKTRPTGADRSSVNSLEYINASPPSMSLPPLPDTQQAPTQPQIQSPPTQSWSSRPSAGFQIPQRGSSSQNHDAPLSPESPLNPFSDYQIPSTQPPPQPQSQSHFQSSSRFSSDSVSSMPYNMSSTAFQREPSIREVREEHASFSMIETPPQTADLQSNEHYRHTQSSFDNSFIQNTLSPLPLHRNTSTGTSVYSGYPFEDDAVTHYNQALLSNLSIYLKDHVPRAEHTRGAIPFPMAFTGQDVVSTIERALSDPFKSRKLAVHIARSMHNQLFFFEVRDNTKPLVDGLDQVFQFIDDNDDQGPPVAGSSTGGNVQSRSSAAWDVELPSGVIVEATSCYSPLCARLTARGIGGGGCLSPSCPNNIHSALLKRKASSIGLDQVPTPPAPEPANWSDTVEPELLNILDKKEIKRQHQIYELIAEEKNYVRDIEVLRTDFFEPLRDANPAIIPPDNQPAFFQDVLLNAFDVKQKAANFSEALINRQREQAPVIQTIGDVALASAIDWETEYLFYYRYYPFADARVRQEKSHNLAFDAFLSAFTRRANVRRLTFNSFHSRINLHLPRIVLMLKSILENTSEENPDRIDIEQAIRKMDELCRMGDAAKAESDGTLECRKYYTELSGPENYRSDLDLLNESRKVVMKSKMFRKKETGGFSDWSSSYAILFDHYFVLTKPQTRGTDTRYLITKRPFPLELLTPMGFEDQPQPKSNRIGLRNLRSDDNVSTGQSARGDDRAQIYPITFQYQGRNGGLFTLYVESEQMRKEWKTKLQTAIAQREALLRSSQVFQLSTMSRDTFLSRTRYQQNGARQGEPSLPFGRPTCSAIFTTPENHSLVAIGHEEGLWIGLRKDSSSFRLVLHLKSITQCAVLQEFGLLLVLANKILIAYPLDALVPSATSQQSQQGQKEKDPQRLSGSKDVLFFRVGRVGPRLLVIYVKKDGVTQTVFKALEPIAIADRGPKGFMRKRTEWFREYKEFFIPSEVFGLLFLRSQLSIVCAKGFELMAIDKEPLRAISFPDWSQLKGDAKAMELQKRCNDSKAVGMYRITETCFLFVFEDLAFYADKHGDPLKERYSDVIDWQGTARTVAFLPPYILAFDTNFVEVRHALTGKLVQIIKGREMLCTYDGASAATVTHGQAQDAERRVHVTLRSESPGRYGEAYEVAELVLL